MNREKKKEHKREGPSKKPKLEDKVKILKLLLILLCRSTKELSLLPRTFALYTYKCTFQMHVASAKVS